MVSSYSFTLYPNEPHLNVVQPSTEPGRDEYTWKCCFGFETKCRITLCEWTWWDTQTQPHGIPSDESRGLKRYSGWFRMRSVQNSTVRPKSYGAHTLRVAVQELESQTLQHLRKPAKKSYTAGNGSFKDKETGVGSIYQRNGYLVATNSKLMKSSAF